MSRANAAGGWLSAQRLCLACIGLCCGCGATDVIADLARDGAITSEAGASGAPADAPADAGSASASGENELQAWCSGQGGLWTIRGNGQAAFTCASELAAESFGRHALCVCGSLMGPGAVSTAMLSGVSAPANGASVGVNGASLLATTPGAVPAANASLPSLTVGGDLVLAGLTPLQLAAGPQRVSGNLRSSAALGSASGQTTMRVDGDAWLPVDSSLDPRALDVGGELVLSPAGVAGPETQRWSGARSGAGVRRGDVSVQAPCACDLQRAPDVPATVSWAAQHNDNALLGFPTEQLYWVENATELSLPCGRFHFPTINGTGVLTLRIDQPVALFVGDLLGIIEVQLGPQGSLDLFVAGLFQPRGGVLGDRARPYATRIYVHDQPMPGPLAMIGELVSNFYGPSIGVQAFNTQRRGSIVVRDAIITDSLRVEYDPRVSELGSCGAP